MQLAKTKIKLDGLSHRTAQQIQTPNENIEITMHGTKMKTQLTLISQRRYRKFNKNIYIKIVSNLTHLENR